MEYLLIHVSANWDLKTLGELAGFWRVPFPSMATGVPHAILGEVLPLKQQPFRRRAMGNPAVQWLSNMTSTTNTVDPTMVKRSSVDVEYQQALTEIFFF